MSESNEQQPDAAVRPDWMLRALDDVAGTADWLAALRKHSVRTALPALVVRLDRLANMELAPEIRLALMRLYKRPALKVCASLPNPDPRLAHGGLGDSSGLTAEQRLDRLMCANLNRLFQELDRQRYRCAAASEENRHWALSNLFKFYRRQVRYAWLAGRKCPPHTWQGLHDLLVYLVIRGNVQLDAPVRLDAFDDDFDAEVEYKRLLLMGCAAQQGVTGQAALDMLPHLRDWSNRTRLSDPAVHSGRLRLLLVEVAYDRPLRVTEGSFREGFRGWILLPPREFLEVVEPAVRHRQHLRAA